MFTIEDIFTSELKKDNSKFLAYLLPIEQFNLHLTYLKKEHKKAVHFVQASRILNEYSQIVEYSTDDGEPKGSSGIPTLNVIRGNDLINIGIIIVRYFGRKLLGVGGLVRAYTNVSISVIEKAKLIKFEQIKTHALEIPFNKVEMAKYLAKKLEINFIQFDFMQNFAIISIKSSIDKIDKFLDALNLHK